MTVSNPSACDGRDLIARIPAGQTGDALAALTVRVYNAHKAVQAATANALAVALDAGDALLEVKQLLQDCGLGWEGWLQDWKFFKLSTARLYMQLAKHRAEIEAKLAQIPGFSIRDARRLIRALNTPEESAAATEAATEIDNEPVSLVPPWVVAFNQASPQERTQGLAILGPADIIAVMPGAMRDTFMARAARVIGVGVPHDQLSNLLQTILNHIDIADDPKTGQTEQRFVRERAARKLLTVFAAQIGGRDVQIVLGAAKKRAA